MKRRRLLAADMFKKGKPQADVARALGVSPQSVSIWYRTWQEGGREALKGAGRAGRLPYLDDDDLAAVVTALKKGPRANGITSDLWTLARVSDVIEQVTGVRYSQTQTWSVLHDRLGWSRQRPSRKALERDEGAIATWVAEDWPRIKKAPGAGAPGSSSKTKAASASSRR
jgi:transposase